MIPKLFLLLMISFFAMSIDKNKSSYVWFDVPHSVNDLHRFVTFSKMHGLRDLLYPEKKGRFARNLDFNQQESHRNEEDTSGEKSEVNMSHLISSATETVKNPLSNRFIYLSGKKKRNNPNVPGSTNHNLYLSGNKNPSKQLFLLSDKRSGVVKGVR